MNVLPLHQLLDFSLGDIRLVVDNPKSPRFTVSARKLREASVKRAASGDISAMCRWSTLPVAPECADEPSLSEEFDVQSPTYEWLRSVASCSDKGAAVDQAIENVKKPTRCTSPTRQPFVDLDDSLHRSPERCFRGLSSGFHASPIGTGWGPSVPIQDNSSPTSCATLDLEESVSFHSPMQKLSIMSAQSANAVKMPQRYLSPVRSPQTRRTIQFNREEQVSDDDSFCLDLTCILDVEDDSEEDFAIGENFGDEIQAS